MQLTDDNTTSVAANRWRLRICQSKFMTTYIYTSLYGTEAADALAYSSKYDPHQDTLTMYTSIYGLGGNDAIQISSDDLSLYIDAGEGDDHIISDRTISPLPNVTVYGGAGDDVVQYFSDVYNPKTKLDGGEGYDKLILDGRFDPSRSVPVRHDQRVIDRFSCRIIG